MSQGFDTPDYLPARMLNEYVYCPRLFYYEWVEGLFAHNRETVEGTLRHAAIDDHEDEFVPVEELSENDRIHSCSVTLSSDTHRLIAKMDLIEVANKVVTPVDYKRGRPYKHQETGDIEAWESDRVQSCVQALVLRDNQYQCDEAVVYYVATRQRVRVPIDSQLIDHTLRAMRAARAVADAKAGTEPCRFDFATFVHPFE